MYWNRLIFLCISFLLLQWNGMSQSEVEKDSLDNASRSSKVNDLSYLNEVATYSKSPDTQIKYATILVEKSLRSNSRKYLMMGYQNKGTAWRVKGEFDKSLDNLFKAAEIAEKLRLELNLGEITVEIGNTYSESGDTDLASDYYSRGLELIKKSGDSVAYALALYNQGDALYEKRQLDKALDYIQQATSLFQATNQKWYEAHGKGNLGRIYTLKGQYNKAEPLLLESLKTLETIPDYNGMADYYASLSNVYRSRNSREKAVEFMEKGLAAAEKIGQKNDLRDIHYNLSEMYEELGDPEQALGHYKDYVLYKDSVQNLATIQEMANQRSDFEIAQKQAELNLLQQQKKNQEILMVASGVAFLLILLLALGLYRRNKFIGRTKKIIEKEKARSDHLLLNILPHETAQELKEKGKVKAKRFDSVSILFTDFRNFTYYAENLTPEELVESVDFYYTEFDRITEKYGLEKIKTVGDAYMCAAGVPFPVKDHAIRAVEAACEMMEFVTHAKKLNEGKKTRFDVRIGINTGPVIAGVVGDKKFAYDIWGDSVNIASRMESSSENGRINISEYTYQLVKDNFDCLYRGEIEVKHKGMMKMYYVKGKKTFPVSNMRTA